MSLELVICVLRLQLHSEDLSLNLIPHRENLCILQVLVNLINNVLTWLQSLLILVHENVLTLVRQD